MLYCDAADLYDYGLPRGALPNPGRLVAAVYPASDTLELDGHGLRAGAPLVFRAEAGGALPAPLAAGTTYYALPLTDSTFKVSATDGGAAVNLTTDGSGIVVTTPLAIAKVIEKNSRLIDDWLPAHLVPLTEPVPVVVRSACAQLSANELLSITGQASAPFAMLQAALQKQLERWARGVPLRDPSAPARANLAVARGAAGDRGWDGGAPGRLP